MDDDVNGLGGVIVMKEIATSELDHGVNRYGRDA